MLRARSLVVLAVMVTVFLGSGFAFAMSYRYTGYSIDPEDAAVEVVLGRVKAPSALWLSAEGEYVNRRHGILTQIAQPQPTQTVKGIVVFRDFVPLRDVERILLENQLTASYVWFGRNGALGTGTVRVMNNDLKGAFDAFKSDLLELAAEERKQDPDVAPNDITQQSGLAVDEFKVFAVQVSGPAMALDRVKKLSSVRLVDVEHHPQAKRLADERGLALKFNYAPMRPDGL